MSLWSQIKSQNILPGWIEHAFCPEFSLMSWVHIGSRFQHSPSWSCFARSPVPILMPAVGLVHGGRATGLVKPKQACGTSPQGGERCAAGAVLPSTESPEFEPSTPSTVSERSSPVSDHEEDKLGESAPNSHGPPKDKVAPDSSRVSVDDEVLPMTWVLWKDASNPRGLTKQEFEDRMVPSSKITCMTV